MISAQAQMLLDSSGIFPTQQEQVVYTSNSVQIEACASIPNVPSASRAAFQDVLSQTIGGLISTSTLFLTRVYSDSSGNLCFFYVYQAPNQDSARAAFAKLSPQGVGSAQSFSLTIIFNSLPYVCTVSTSVWQNEDSLPFGVKLPFQWTADDILLWALCGGALLSVAAISACCCVLHFSARRETAILESIVALDQKVLAKMQQRYTASNSNMKKKGLNKSTAKKADAKDVGSPQKGEENSTDENDS